MQTDMETEINSGHILYQELTYRRGDAHDFRATFRAVKVVRTLDWQAS